jgi:hypothetical protein
MINYLLIKVLVTHLREYIFIFSAIIIFLFISFSKSVAEENIFTINNVKVEGSISTNFSRERYLNKAFLESFDLLLSKILLTRDIQKVNNTSLKEIKFLINSFKISEESYRENIYRASISISFNKRRIKKFLRNLNLSFFQPEKISVVFFPVLYIEDNITNYNENFFYRKWNEIKIKNELINFILPLDDLEDISSITKMKNKIEELNIQTLASKYNEKNYVFALMDLNNKKLNVYLKTNFNNNKISKNILYDIKDIKSETELTLILKDLKLKIMDIWKEDNLVNLLMPLSINIKFYNKTLKNLNQAKLTLNNIDIIESYTLEEFNINNSFFKIYYFGNPKKLKSELYKRGYILENNQGLWQLYLDE